MKFTKRISLLSLMTVPLLTVISCGAEKTTNVTIANSDITISYDGINGSATATVAINASSANHDKFTLSETTFQNLSNDDSLHIVLVPVKGYKLSRHSINISVSGLTITPNQPPSGGGTTGEYNFNIDAANLKSEDNFWTIPQSWNINYIDLPGTTSVETNFYKDMTATNNKYGSLSFDDWYTTFDVEKANILNDSKHTYTTSSPNDYSSSGSQYDIYAKDNEDASLFPTTGNNNNPLTGLYSGAQFEYVGTSKTFNQATAVTTDGSVYGSPYVSGTAQPGNGWEHVTPQSTIKTANTAGSVVSRKARGDVHNLRPAMQNEFNGPRSNNPFGMIAGDNLWNYGSKPSYQQQVDFEIGNSSFGYKVVEPRINVRGDIARTMFYMHDRYHVVFEKDYYKQLLLWAIMDPVTPEEISYNNDAAGVMGFKNEYVDGTKQLPYLQEMYDLIQSNLTP